MDVLPSSGQAGETEGSLGQAGEAEGSLPSSVVHIKASTEGVAQTEGVSLCLKIWIKGVPYISGL